MLEKLLIQNFQAHAKTSIEFDPNITCIVGPSDSGKSAIIRALRWVCMNSQPKKGTSFINWSAKGCTVKLLVDGRKITRKRNKNETVNEYWLDKESYKSFGRDVPDPISNFLNIDEISWQGQHDSPYWFNATAGEVSRQLNAIVDLSIIDSTLSAVARTVSKSATKLEIAEEAEKKAKSNFAALEWVPEYVKEVEVLKTLEKIATSKRAGVSCISVLYNDAKKHHITKERYSAVVECGKITVSKGHEALQTRKNLAAIKDLIVITKRVLHIIKADVPDISVMQKAVKEHRESRDRSIILRKLITDVKRFRGLAKKEIPDIVLMEKLILKHKKLKNDSRSICTIINSIQKLKKEISDQEKEIESIKKEMPKVCPTCNQPLK